MDYNERTYTQQHVFGADFLSKTVNCVHNGINVSIYHQIYFGDFEGKVIRLQFKTFK